MSRSKHGTSRGPNPLVFVIAALIVIAVALVVVILLVGGDSRQEPQSAAALPKLEEPVSTENAQPQKTEAEAPAAVDLGEGEEMAIQEEPDGDVWVETPYCNLIYPFEMSDTLRVESVTVDDGLSVVFYGGINDLEEALYAVHFGAEAGFPVGTLALADGTEITVRAEIFEIVPEDSWDEGEINTLYAMQECVNDTLAQLQQEAGFTAAE